MKKRPNAGMQKVRCRVSHETPSGDGKFTVYEAGRTYELTGYDPAYFEPVKTEKAKEEVTESADE